MISSPTIYLSFGQCNSCVHPFLHLYTSITYTFSTQHPFIHTHYTQTSEGCVCDHPFIHSCTHKYHTCSDPLRTHSLLNIHLYTTFTYTIPVEGCAWLRYRGGHVTSAFSQHFVHGRHTVSRSLRTYTFRVNIFHSTTKS